MTRFRHDATLESSSVRKRYQVNLSTGQPEIVTLGSLTPINTGAGTALGWYRCLGLAALAVISMAGCGQRLPYVSGSVTLDGELVRGSDNLQCIVLFFPADGNGAPAFAVVDESGEYSLDTGSTSGALEGRYDVAITVAEITLDGNGGLPRSRHLAPEKYADPSTSGWSVEVVGGSNEFNFSIQTQPQS